MKAKLGKRKFGKLLVGVILLVVLCALHWISRPETLGHYQAQLRKNAEKLQRHAQDEGWLAVVDFSGTVMRNQANGEALDVVGSTSVSRSGGVARQFEGNGDHYIPFGLQWADASDAFSVGMRLNLRSVVRPQCILGVEGQGVKHGLFLDGGTLRFFLTEPDGQRHSVSYAVPRWDTWFHLCVTYTRDTGNLCLYVDGVLQDETSCADFTALRSEIFIGRQESMRSINPFWGAVDDVVISKHAIDARSVRRLSSQAATLDSLLSGKAVEKNERYGRLVRYMKPLAHARARLFHHAPFQGASPEEEVSTLELVLSEEVLAEFGDAWRMAQAEGVVPMDRLDLEDVVVQQRGGEGVEEDIGYFLPDTAWLDSDACSWVVANQSGWSTLNSPWVVVAPAAVVDWRDLALASHIAVTAGIIDSPWVAFQRVVINGVDRGLHLVCDYQTMVSENRAWLHRALDVNRLAGMGEEPLKEWAQNHLAPLSEAAARSAGSSEELEAYLAHEGSVDGWLAGVAAAADESDFRRLRVGLIQWGPARVMGNNPLAGVVLNPLSLPKSFGGEFSFSYSSSDESVLASDGSIVQRNDDTLVALTEVATLGNETMTNKFSLWVPELPLKMPLFDLRSRHRLRSSPRDYGVIAEWQPDEEGTYAPTFDAVAVKYRGNTKLYRHKKSYSIDAGKKHGLFETEKATHFYLNIFDADESYVRDPLAMAFFREIAGLSTNEVPEISFALGFHNKYKKGIYHLTERMSRRFLGWKKPQGGGLGDGVLIKARHIHFDPELPMHAEQLYPDVENATGLSYLDDLMAIVHGPKESFQRDLAKVINLDHFMAYHINLLLSGNVDGDANNFFLYAERNKKTGELGEWIIMPWDFDHGFGSQSFQFNYLTRRLEKEHPAYRSRMVSRWRELRAGPFADAAMDALITAVHTDVAPYTAFDQAAWGDAPDTHANEMTRLREWVRDRLQRLDAYMDELDAR